MDNETQEIQNEKEIAKVQSQVESAGYIDLSKANNTKIIVIGSLICVILILILSILFPPAKEETQEQTATEVTTEVTTEGRK